MFEAVDNNRAVRVALKRTQKAGNVVSREYEILSMLRGSPNVIQMVDFFYSMSAQSKLIQNTVMEFCDCSLEDKLRHAEKIKRPMSMEEIKCYTRQIFNGLRAMHEQGIAHRDLKPENILLKVPGNDKNLTSPVKFYQVDQCSLELKICDMGAAKVLDKATHHNTPYVVSRYYRAPELILGSNKYDESIDVWATGCILFELITRTPMFPGDAEGM